jgi:hypothetical protein
MWRVFSNAIEMFVYSAVYLVIVLVSLKIVGSIFATDFERKVAEQGNVALALVCAAVFIGFGILLSSVVR